MHSAQCVQNNKQPTKGLRRACSNPNELAAAEGKQLCSAAQSPCVPGILITATEWCELGLRDEDGGPPTPALAQPHGDRDGLLAVPW